MDSKKKNRAGRGKFTTRMQKKLVVLYFLVLLAFIGLSARLFLINRDNGEQYKKQVLSQQQYDSTTIPFKRGDILDAKGTKLAVSEKVYNVILDAKQAGEKEEYVNATVQALASDFGLNESELRSYIAENPSSRYHVLAKQLTYDQISNFVMLQEDAENNPDIKGVWFEEEYRRSYPNETMACDAIGFTNNDNNGTYGLEEFYNDILNGTNGREYGYLNDDSTLERTTIAAVDGNSLVTTIDANIQSIVEKYLKQFNEDNKDVAREGNGANNVGCIIMNCNSGEVLAMASYPNFNLNDPYDLSAYYTEDEVNTMKEDGTYYDTLNGLWRNYCISDTYEPGSVSKTFTVAAGLDSGKLTGNETYNCTGYLEIGGYKIRCHNRYGDGVISVKDAIAKSCNVALMYMGQAMGKDVYLRYQHTFNIGLKTNIDLSGEARTDSLVGNAESMGTTELATATFGQGFNVTMIQMITGFCSLINGGYYYEPHMVSKIQSSDGATVQNIEPRVLKQTIASTTSDKIREYCNAVVTDGTGKTARPAGYAIGGKTGTAQTLPRGNGEYVVSFMGYAPADDPQIAIYVVVDRPNTATQDDAKFATGIVRNVLSEVLPYLNIYMTEELSDDERAELEAKQIAILEQYAIATVSANGTGTVSENGTETGETSPEGEGEPAEGEASGEAGSEGEEANQEVWKTFPIDPATGYAVDPDTGLLVDPTTGATVNDNSDFMEKVTEE
ncbi:MAG: penicillin-binding transpeptidase domain-containing protein [Lachnospiraceae bacterium]|nr:penicillin-binding transpeptidase domain-containing protein [Lachnospiraceae bacterium]